MRRVLVLLAVAVSALLAGRGQQAIAVNNTLLVDADTSTTGIQNSVVVSPGGGSFTVQVWVQNVTTTNCHPLYPSQPCGLGGYTLEMHFDPAVLSYQSFADGPFLRSTNPPRPYSFCPLPVTNKHDPAHGVIAITCTTQGWDYLGPTGSGHLATVTFTPVAIGFTTLVVDQSQLSDIAGNPICHPNYTPCNTQNGTVTVNYKADLRVTKTAPSPVAAPGTISYTLNVTNLGPNQAQGVSLVDTLPAEVGFSSASQGCNYVSGDHKVNCDLGTLTNGQNKTVNIAASVAASQAGKSVLNKADVTTTSVDQVASNNHAETSTQVSASNISITKTAPRDVSLGAAGQYVINVGSSGPSTAVAVAVQDTLPSGVSYVHANSSIGTCSYDGGLRKVTCSLGDMAPSTSATITIGVTFPGTATYVGNSATATWTKTPSGSTSFGPVWTYVGLPDTDRDGCHDFQELGSDPTKGGQRNPNNPWDFYDVPVPARLDPTPNGATNFAINFQDVLGVLSYVGTQENGPLNLNLVDYDSLKDGDWNGDTLLDNNDKVGRRYDRSPSAPFSGPPSGAVNFQDVLVILAQVGHSCAAPPA